MSENLYSRRQIIGGLGTGLAVMAATPVFAQALAETPASNNVGAKATGALPLRTCSKSF